MSATTDDVVVPRAALRGMRSLVAGVVAVLVLLAAGLGLMAFDSQERCEASNEFRRRDLPAAFRDFGEFLGAELGAPPADVDEANDRFAARLDARFPERDCPLF